MAVSMKNLDPAFQGVGQKPGLEIWRIQNFSPVPLPKSDHGKFYSGDSYIILRTTATRSGALRHDLHFWLGKDTSQDEAGTAALKAVELDAALGGRAVQYREVQGYESEKFLTYFKPCIIPLEGGYASGFKHPKADAYEPRLFVCKGRRAVRVKQVPFARSSLNHDDVFILDTESKIYQFNGVTSSIQERAKALEVVQYIKDNDHEGKCAIAIIEDGKMAAEADTGEFWGLFGGFAPIGKKAATKDDVSEETVGRLLCVVEGNLKEVAVTPLKRELLETSQCYLLDAGPVVYVWIGRNTSLEERKRVITAADEYVSQNKPSSVRVVRVIEGFETLSFKSCFEAWRAGTAPAAVVSEEGRGKVAALLKQQGINVKGLLKGAPVKEETPTLLESPGKLEIWRVEGKSKTSLPANEHGKFYAGDSYIVLYTCQGDQKEIDHLVCLWQGKESTEEARSSGISQMQEIRKSLKGKVVQARICQEKEPPQFIALFESMVIMKGGLSSDYKQLISKTGAEDDTYTEESLALFRVRGTKHYDGQALQVEPVSTSLNSSDCFILQTSSKALLLWFGSFSTLEEQQMAAHMATFLKPGSSPKSLKEGAEPPTFWNALGGKKVYPSQREPRDADKDPRLFVYTKNTANLLPFEEVHNYTQDDLLSDDIIILDTQNEVFLWIGQKASAKEMQDFTIAESYVERANVLDGLASETPIFTVLEGCEPAFFTKYFSWDPLKSAVYVDPFERRLAALQGRAARTLETPPKRRLPSTAAAESVQKPEKASLSPRSSQKKSPLSSGFGSPKPPSTPASEINGNAIKAEEQERAEVTNEAEAKPDGTYSYESLKVKSSCPAVGIDVTKRETYLSPEEFRNVFGMNIEQFQALPKWKRDQYKKAADLF